ncbi:hypothetical protein NDU88_001206 [Pleurodeles waltl]|uniref:Uncharacterized protein n=1 Tax=Pleurodeles waltl TaxID=8319 RepID=A0AAV7RAY1_PLEWA|nr:hypothetical protein NDU88_001206 [Pleurodeles waltl]
MADGRHEWSGEESRDYRNSERKWSHGGQMESRTSAERRIRRCASKAGIGSRVESRRSAEQRGTITIRGSRVGYNYREEGGHAQQPAVFQEERSLAGRCEQRESGGNKSGEGVGLGMGKQAESGLKRALGITVLLHIIIAVTFPLEANPPLNNQSHLTTSTRRRKKE